MERKQFVKQLKNSIGYISRYHQQFLDSPETRLQGADLMSSFPRIAFDLGFYVGKIELIISARAIYPAIEPSKDCTITTLEKDGESFISENITYHKTEDEVNWQKWRLDGILTGCFQKKRFPTYQDSILRELNTNLAYNYSNVNSPLGSKSSISLPEQIIPFKIIDRQLLTHNEDFRFKYIVECIETKVLLEEIVN